MHSVSCVWPAIVIALLGSFPPKSSRIIAPQERLDPQRKFLEPTSEQCWSVLNRPLCEGSMRAESRGKTFEDPCTRRPLPSPVVDVNDLQCDGDVVRRKLVSHGLEVDENGLLGTTWNLPFDVRIQPFWIQYENLWDSPLTCIADQQPCSLQNLTVRFDGVPIE